MVADANNQMRSHRAVLADFTAGLVVCLVTVPLSLGVAQASNAPLSAGLLAALIGGLLVASFSPSQVSVSGSAAGMSAIILSQIGTLGSFQAFLTAVVLAGLIQVGIAVLRLGSISNFVPNSVIRGLLTAVGLILILKQIPHLLGHDTDPEGEMSFFQPDRKNTLSELLQTLIYWDIHSGAALIGGISLVVLLLWNRFGVLRRLPVPGPLVVVAMGVVLNSMVASLGEQWALTTEHLIHMPPLSGFAELLAWPDLTALKNPQVFTAALLLAFVASLESLLNLEAIDKIDPRHRITSPNRELLAQGIGNIAAGCIGGLPITSLIAHSAVNIHSGGRTKRSAIIQGTLLFLVVMFAPEFSNRIPLSCLAAILLVTGWKLANLPLARQMLGEGRYQFIPFATTVVAIVFSDLIIGMLIGLAVSVTFILLSNLKRPLRCRSEKHLGGEVLRIELANQVSFLNRAAFDRIFNEIPRGGHVLLDARHTSYIDPDILSLIREFTDRIAPVRGIQVSLRGFRRRYNIKDEIQYVDYSTRELQAKLTGRQVLQILKEGNERFRMGEQLPRDPNRQLQVTAQGQHPLAVVFTCIDSRSPAEIIFDLGLGDIFSVRIAGNIVSAKVLGSLEYGCAVAGAKLIVVLGHTNCGAVTAAIKLAGSPASVEQATGCQHLQPIVREIQQAIGHGGEEQSARQGEHIPPDFVNEVARENVRHTVRRILQESQTISRLVRDGQLVVAGAMYDITTGQIDFFLIEDASTQPVNIAAAS